MQKNTLCFYYIDIKEHKRVKTKIIYNKEVNIDK